MNIAFGHTNMDLDCLGSLILVKKMFPDFRLVRSNRVNPLARNIIKYYEASFDFLTPADLKNKKIEKIIVVDTCMAERVKEYFNNIRSSTPDIYIIDHHPRDFCNILGARFEDGTAGSNTSLVGKMAMKQNITLTSEEATIALTGIYADTGRLIHENVTHVDFEVAAWLLGMGASLKLVKSFLETIKEDEQQAVLNRILISKNEKIIQGHLVLFSFLDLEDNISGLAAVVDRIMEIENPDAYFAVFNILKNNTTLLIARSQTEGIDLHNLLQNYGGGGHQAAASATIKDMDGRTFFVKLHSHLEKSLVPAVRARDIMSMSVNFINENNTLLEASKLLEEVNHTGMPVLNDREEVSGFISLKDIMKGRKASAMHAPISAYMSKPAISADAFITMREVEIIFYRHNIGYIPILENQKLAGIVTRYDFLQYKNQKSSI